MLKLLALSYQLAHILQYKHNVQIILWFSNIALHKSTWQSPGWMPSHLAVDGDNTTNYGAGSCTHTGVMIPNPTWAVDLGHRYQVFNDNITNRGDSCGMYSNYLKDIYYPY